MPGIPFGRFINMLGNKITNIGAGTAATDAVNKGQLDAARDFAISRTNHTGSQLADTITNFDAAVRLNRLDQLAAPTSPVNFNGQVLNGLADPATAQQAATKSYVDSQLAGVSGGLQTKGSVKAAIGVNVNTASPGATVDGVTPANGDVLLLTAQSTAGQNGPWVYNGASSAMTRPTNFDTSGEALLGSFWIVRENSTTLNSHADSMAVMSNDTAITLGTTALTFTYVKLGVTASTPVAVNIGNGSLTTLRVAHNFGTRDVSVTVYRNGSPWEDVWVEIQRPDTNNIDILFDNAPALNEYRVIVAKEA